MTAEVDDDSTIFETCDQCAGQGGWTEMYYDAAIDCDVDIDIDCAACSGTGRR